MKSNSDIYDFILDNIQKIIVPEEMIEIDLSITRFELLALVLAGRLQTVTMSNLAQGMSVPMSTATGIVDRLVKKGLLARGSQAEDRRVVTVCLTDDGQALVGKLKEHFHWAVDRVRRLITEEEFAFAWQLVCKIIQGLQKEASAADKTTVQQRRKIEIE